VRALRRCWRYFSFVYLIRERGGKMNADWMQARIAELERVNAALVAERDAAVEKQVHWMEVSTSWVNRCAVAHRERDAAVRELGVEVERRLMAVRDVNYLADQCHLLRRWSALWKRAAHRLWRESGREFRMLVASLYGSPATRRAEGIDLFGRDDIEDDDPENVYGPLDPETEAGLREWIRAQAVVQRTQDNNATLNAERDAAVRELGIEVKRRLELERIMFLNRTYPTIEHPPTDEDEMIARLETTVRGWQPGTTAGKECRGNAGDGYRTQEREDDHV